MTEQTSGSPDAPAPNKKKHKRLTKKQAALARARLKNPEATLAELGEQVEYSSRANVSRALALPHVQDRMRALMDLRPKTCLPGLLKKLEKGLDATLTKVASFEGQITDEREYDDMPTQARFLEIASNWHGLDEKRVRISMDPTPPMSLAEAQKILLQVSLDAEQE